MTALAACAGAGRTFGMTVALQPTGCHVDERARIAITGPSGSGKSTLLHLLAGLDDPTVGTVAWPLLGNRSALRPGPVAVIFQGPSLLPALTVRENVALPLVLGGAREQHARVAADDALASLALDELADKLPEEISGGQAQRVAVARALAGHPRLILADEPTSQVDRANATAIVDVLLSAAADADAALVVATHDPLVAERLHEPWQSQTGRLESGGAAWSP